MDRRERSDLLALRPPPGAHWSRGSTCSMRCTTARAGRFLWRLSWCRKPLQCDLVTREVKRKSERTKNEMLREMLRVCVQNALKFRFVLMDSWFSSEENFEFIISQGKDFIAALRDNRLVALSLEDWKAKRFVRVDKLEFPEQGAVQGWLRGLRVQSTWSARSLKTKTAAPASCIWFAATSPATTTPSPRTTKTVASGGVPQIPQVQRRYGQVTHPDLANPKQPCLHGHRCHLQTRMPQHQGQAQPLALRLKLLINATRSAYHRLAEFHAAPA